MCAIGSGIPIGSATPPSASTPAMKVVGHGHPCPAKALQACRRPADLRLELIHSGFSKRYPRRQARAAHPKGCVCFREGSKGVSPRLRCGCVEYDRCAESRPTASCGGWQRKRCRRRGGDQAFAQGRRRRFGPCGRWRRSTSSSTSGMRENDQPFRRTDGIEGNG